MPSVARVRPDQRYAWCGPSLLVTTARGECDDTDALTGYYFREARHLRTLRLRVNGTVPWICADGEDGARGLSFVYAYPELTRFGGGGTDVSDDTTWTDDAGVRERAIDIRVEHRAEPHGLTTTAALANRSLERVRLELVWEVDADFADIQEAFSGNREQTAAVETTAEDGGLTLHYRHERLPLETRVRVAGADWRVEGGRLAARVELEPRAQLTLTLTVRPCGGDASDASDASDAISEDDAAERLARLAAWHDARPSLETPGDTGVAALLAQAGEDLGNLALLEGPPEEWLAVQAGIPLYPALFGRDAITCGWQAAMIDRGDLLDAALRRLGRLQSDRVLDWSDEQPGRIPYQVRAGPLARLGVNPYAAYYADFASPLMFVISLAHRFAWSGDAAFLRRHWDAARRILDWARSYGDRDGDGYLEYETRSPKGTKNQGWKDSGNAILYEDGRPVPAPLGTCDLQGYWFAAQQLAAGLSWVLGDRDEARALWRAADELKARFNRDWWMEDEGFVALALDADKRLARSVTSNVGQCLAAGIIADEHIPRVVGRLFAPDMFSGWGIRTLSTEHVAYNPLAYHLGTVWPVENATIVFGLRRFGLDQRALDLARAMLDLARLYERGRAPECVGGYARAELPQPGAYPRANPIQAWNQSGLVMVMQSLLGLQPLAPLDTLVVDPVLPEWLPEVTVRGLRVGGATATVRFARDASGRSHAEVVEKRGTLHLLHQPPPESLTAGPTDRLRALLTSAFHH
jgi:glycogen debranching enzyme